MTCLDTNYLILGLVSGSSESARLIYWVKSGEPLITPAIAWYEFLCGPVTQPQIDTIRAFITTIAPFRPPEAHTASELFNATGRKRALRVDAMIAATAISAGADLATNNTADFALFRPHGLTLAP